MLPASLVLTPLFLIFSKLGILNSYFAPILSTATISIPFVVLMLRPGFLNMPKELEDAAKIDGCNSFQIFIRILLPILKPSMISVCIFQTIWVWNDFMNPLIYINSVSKYPLSLALRMGLDVAVSTNWNEIMSMACVSILPLVILFFCLQKYFVEGIASSGLKG